MSATFTPGPWVFAHKSRRDQRFEVAQVENFCIYAEIFPPFPATGRPEDDARLIAAAPLMLEACRAMVEWDERERDHAVDFYARMELCRSAFEKTRAAIAAATGEQP